MADLEGKTIASTYESLLNVGTANNQNLDGTPRVIADGVGTSEDATYDDEVLVALDETGLAGGGSTDGNYYITIPPEGSICLRGDGTNLECREVYVKCASGKTTQIEYLIAKE